MPDRSPPQTRLPDSIFTCDGCRMPAKAGAASVDTRTALIITALLAVLLSAFGAERFHACHGDQRCVRQTATTWLPGFIRDRQAVREAAP